ncbi:MAG: hypothetical protein RMJ46_00165 [Bacteroidota bacterium]|nr:hypothetical protein [Bacteroidota bacterium]
MVTFSHIPYAEALRRGQIQDRILDTLMTQTETETDWENPRLQQLMVELVVELEPYNLNSLSGAAPE